MEKKGQAAMEFLMTYGWAILVVLIAIGALAYFGVLNPSRFLPASCTIMPGVSCDSFKVTASTVSLNVRNGMGNDLTGVTFTTCGGTSASTSIGDGATASISIACDAGNVTGAKYKGDLVFAYTENNLAHSRTGQIVAPVEP